MLRLPLLAAALFAVLPAAAAQAGPCQPGPQHPPLRANFEDLTLDKVLAGPPTVYAGHRIGIDATFDDPGNHGHDGVIPGSLKISAPGAPTTTQDDGHKLAVIPQAAGTIPVTFTWTESQNAGASDPVPTCDGSAEVAMTVLEPKPATVKLRTVKAVDNPSVELHLALGFADNGDASPVTMRARVVKGSNPPSSGLKTIATLAIDNVSKDIHRQLGKGSGGAAELFYETSGGGGDANILWTTTNLRKRFGTLVTAKRKIVSRGALSVDLVQRGKVRTRLRTRIECGTGLPGKGAHYSCRTLGLKLTTA